MGRRPERFAISCSTRRERHEAISLAQDAIRESGGCLLDFTMFSNLSICLNLEVREDRLCALYEALIRTGARLSSESEADHAARRARQEEGAVERTEELIGTIHVTFIHDEPDLRREVPAIPG